MHIGSTLYTLIFTDTLQDLDKWLFLLINRGSSNGFFDMIFPWWRHQDTWIPLYLFLLLFMLMNFGWKSWKWVLGIAVTVALTDQISSSFFKEYFGRLRPCRDPEFAPFVRMIASYCPGSGSFTSSHAANHFGATVFIHRTLIQYLPNRIWLFYLWAISICYAQVYVGVHYPSDVAGGALLGIIIGYCTSQAYHQWVNKVKQ